MFVWGAREEEIVERGRERSALHGTHTLTQAAHTSRDTLIAHATAGPFRWWLAAGRIQTIPTRSG